MIATTFALLAPALSFAQEPPKTLTQMLVGLGPLPGARAQSVVPAYMIGLEVKPASSRVTWRIMTEAWQSQYHHCAEACDQFARSSLDSWGKSSSFGLQAIGVRPFGKSRIQPYLFGGAGLYSLRSTDYSPQLIATNPITLGNPVLNRRSEVTPSLIWGTGFNARIRRANLFGEARLPLWTGRGGFQQGPQAPIMFGLRF
jgi:hypothetical protein